LGRNRSNCPFPRRYQRVFCLTWNATASFRTRKHLPGSIHNDGTGSHRLVFAQHNRGIYAYRPPQIHYSGYGPTAARKICGLQLGYAKPCGKVPV
jgi:hypothetical protein